MGNGIKNGNSRFLGIKILIGYHCIALGTGVLEILVPGRLNSCFSPVVMYLYKASAYSMGVLPLLMKKSFLQLNISIALSKQYFLNSTSFMVIVFCENSYFILTLQILFSSSPLLTRLSVAM